MALQSLGAPASRLTDLVSLNDLLGIVRPAWKSGNYYIPTRERGTGTAGAWVAGAQRASLFLVERDMMFASVYLSVAAISSGGNCNFAFYGIDQYGMITAAPVFQSGAFALTSSNTLTGVTPGSPITLPKGFYWMVCQCDSAGPTFLAWANDGWVDAMVGGLVSSAVRTGTTSFALAQAYGAFPTSPTLTETTGNLCPYPVFKIA